MKKLSVLILTVLSYQTMCAQEIFDKQAHRGGRGLMPENTIPAMKLALDYGNTLEMDITFSKDKKVLVSHDQWMNSLFVLDPEGKELPKGKDANIYKMDYKDIKKYDVGSKFHKAFPQQKKIKAQIPLLADLIDTVEHYAKIKNYPAPHYNMETKMKESGDNIFHPEPKEFVKRLMRVIKNKNIESRVIIQSFDTRSLEIIHKKYKNVKTAYLVSSGELEENLKKLSFKPDIYSPTYKLVTSELVASCKKLGIKVLPWTVNTKSEIESLKTMGVDGIITDYPNLF
ncbi:glycerophosphodiester phosphodiesterase family protein [Pedobacter arcticus]|uniref:glycerophosphodiester phosphodiesterase family protein n=1 Tax=Pedobacter arcticus TaxID=752140 RepID=UPI000364F5BE|nr:glycerophosphodiester phosphodiesterase family protein [Pedobacter arcticus]